MCDRYYTPVHLANSLVERVSSTSIDTILDPACGSGRLLKSAHERFNDASIHGCDIDEYTVRALRRKQPSWHLSVADILNVNSRAQANALQNVQSLDLVLMNPPFTMGDRCYSGKIKMGEEELKCGRGMYYLYKVLEEWSPRIGLYAVLPESSMYSERDRKVRDIIKNRYKISILDEFDESAFKGVNVRTNIVSFEPGKDSKNKKNKREHEKQCIAVRGGLQVHEAKFDNLGIPYVHSSDIRDVISSNTKLRNVRPIGRGIVRGNFILIPRVGEPSKEYLSFVSISKKAQLSDCVIALHVRKGLRRDIINVIDRKMQDIYKGTGPRYITNNRIKKIFSNYSYNVEFKKNMIC